ncbi:DUF4097 family beta strand repeat-containing protein [Pigmentibacter sp. JX0631]|uniref:DUF4097 family beta strand repeat-containing protein n=1 Tax=Pigmentibacter sp. JX0631 TaxID=2976982 RepID=UPI002468FF16|nr:DUF4097 family beta strand repeat-containing protein [Pigmentibacter sp. JX0631]WGL59790.1 DUF4097 family beta strand repeat-containing protein [Pigmentibacter sp. JX0631]
MKLTQSKIVIPSFIGMILCYVTAFALDKDSNRKFSKDFSSEKVHKIYQGLSEPELEISGPTINAKVTTIEGKDVSISVEKKSPNCDLNIKNNSGTIDIEYIDSFSFFKFGRLKDTCLAEIIISTPKNSKLKISTVSGNIDVEGHYKEIKMTSVNGNINVNIDTPEARINSVSGDIYLKGLVKDLDVKNVSGNVNLIYNSLPVIGLLKTSTVSGNVKIEIPKDSQLDYKFQSISGEFKVNNIYINESSKFSINSESVSGDVKIN